MANEYRKVDWSKMTPFSWTAKAQSGSVGGVGVKADSGKARYDLLAPDALAGLVDILTFGSVKYTQFGDCSCGQEQHLPGCSALEIVRTGDHNWEKGIAYGRVFGAAMRHLWAWWRGEENDPESGKSHLDHAACCIHFLSAYTKRNMKEFDDRAILR